MDNDVEEKNSLYRKQAHGQYLSIFSNAAGATIRKLLYDTDKVVRNAIMPENVPEFFSSYTIKGLFKIDETAVYHSALCLKILLRVKIS